MVAGTGGSESPGIPNVVGQLTSGTRTVCAGSDVGASRPTGGLTAGDAAAEADGVGGVDGVGGATGEPDAGAGWPETWGDPVGVDVPHAAKMSAEATIPGNSRPAAPA